MKKWYSLIDVFRFPLRVLLIAVILLGIGDFFQNPNILPYINITNEIFLTVCKVMEYTGSLLLNSLPLLLVIKILSRRYEDSVPAYVGIIAYLLFNIVTMYASSTKLPTYCYTSILGIQTSEISSVVSSGTLKYPLLTGFIGTIIVVWIAKWCYAKSRRRFTYGILAFIDNDTWSFITTLVFTALSAILIAFAWPYFFGMLQNLFNFIGSNIYNPANMFVYGFTERVLSVLDLQDLIHNTFWLGNLGGSWMDAFGKSYTGDVGVWTALFSQNLSTTGYGRFITPYYIMNIFAIPGMLIGIFSTVSDRLTRKRYGLFLAIAILVSITTGMLWPIELFLVITAPALFFMHTVAMSSLYAILASMSVTLGYSYTGTLAYALPGTIISAIPYLTNVKYLNTLIILLIVGIIYFVGYLFMTRSYYYILSGDFLDRKKNRHYRDQFIQALGGIANIRIVNAAVNKLVVSLYDPSKMDIETIKELGAYRIVETRIGTEIELGPRSVNLYRGIAKVLKKYLQQQASKPVVSNGELSKG